MSKEKDLVLVLDVSGSMGEPVRNEGTLMSKIEKLRLEIKELFDEISDDRRILVLTFGDEVNHIYDGNDKYNALAEINNIEPYAGNTAIWDCLGEVLEILDGKGITDAMVACITDGEDNSSGLSRSEVTEEYKKRTGLALKVLILNELLGDRELLEEEEKGEVVHITDFSQIKEKLQINDQRLVDYKELPINATVVNLSEGGEEARDAAGRAMRRIVPFLEKATNLRYYPVPTFIVDRKIAGEAGVKIREVGKITSVDPSEVLVELSKLVKGVAIAFHTGRHYRCSDPSVEDMIEWATENYYKELLPQWSHDERGQLVGFAEAVGICIERYGTGDFNEEDEYIRRHMELFRNNKQLSSNNPFFFLTNVSLVIAKTLGKMNTELRNQLVVESNYFMIFDPDDKRRMRIIEYRPNLEIWARYATDDQMRKLRTSINSDGYWIKKAKVLAEVLEIAVDILKRAYHDLARFKLKFVRVIDELRNFGCYVPAGQKGCQWLKQILFLAGAPDDISIGDTGYVLLYRDVCMEQVGYAPDSPKVTESEIWPALLDSVLCHEHFHAITEEGIGEDGKHCLSMKSGSDKAETVVSEGTAEWSEIEYNRENEEMMRITIEHATSGQLPGWPYRGAIALEEKVQKDGVQTLIEVLKAYREGDPEGALRIFE